jgi:adenosylmethionine-8-amino-7-oxononanoate aminotransferase
LPFPERGREQRTIDALQSLLSAEPDTFAALIVEPLVLGAGGMKMYPARVLTELKQIAERFHTLLIVDEVMTGWGRTGTLFACEQAAISPDILCTSKGITGGALPMAATLCSREIFDAHLSTDRSRMFFHSSSYTANPIACAAAVANLKVWQTEPVAPGTVRTIPD